MLSPATTVKKHILPIIVLAQFACTSVWFAGNAVIEPLTQVYNLPASAMAYLTSAVQMGFIGGTLWYAIFSIADRYSPSKVFFWSACMAAAFNLAVMYSGNTLISLAILRFFTGVFLAGIYPVGMKIAADYFEKGLGKSLGFLVGALVLGTAFPHFLRFTNTGLAWQYVIAFTSVLTLAGGLAIYLSVPNGPYRKAANKFEVKAILSSFQYKNFRSAALGYFGHMWELYAFWVFVPLIISLYNQQHSVASLSVSLYSFVVIGIGSLGCIAAGYLSVRWGARKTASLSLFISAVCCLSLPLVIQASPLLFIVFMLIWGLAVVADSPMFSTLVAQNAEAKFKGTALTIVNCIGFSITIVSIQIVDWLMLNHISPWVFTLLALGPVLGLLAQRKVE